MAEVRKPETLEGVVLSHADRLRRVEAIAASAPSQTVAVELSNQFDTVTSGTFVPTAHSNLPFVLGQVLNVWVVIATDPATTAEVKLTEFYGATETDLLVVPAGEAAGRFCTFEWLHAVHLGDQGCEFRIEARRASGAGNVRAYGPRRFLFDTDLRFPAATPEGNAVLI